MVCPKCGGTNRDGAQYCDSCGEPLAPDNRRRTVPDEDDATLDEAELNDRLIESSGLVGSMAMNRLLHFVAASVLGIVVGLIALAIGQYGFSAFFFVLAVVGILGTRHMLRVRS